MTSFGRSVAFLIGDDRLKKVNDLLLSGGRGVEFAAHLDESLVDMLLEGAEIRLECAEILLECAEVRSEVNEVLSDGIELAAVAWRNSRRSSRNPLTSWSAAPASTRAAAASCSLTCTRPARSRTWR